MVGTGEVEQTFKAMEELNNDDGVTMMNHTQKQCK